MLPKVTYECWLGHVYPKEASQYQGGLYVLNSFLTLLCVLHVYWTVLFIVMIVQAIRTNNNDD